VNNFVTYSAGCYSDDVGVTLIRRTFFSLNALVAISKGKQTVKPLQQNRPVLNWGCWIAHVVLYSHAGPDHP